ncbi:MAG: recombinase family protein [Paludibacteraceae bacterium]|nr:recombinase family protein [Paludibacteraceae bacterium]MBR4563038.1 recombinase family protein [Paludibacteraceae bacterium]
MKTRICIYARVSTQGQDYQRQLTELREYAERMNYEVVREFSEKISGAKTIAERQALTDLLDFAATNHIDKVLVYECSRISRRAIDFLQVIEQLTQMKVSVYILQNGLETLNADKTVNSLCQMVLGIIGQFNAVERSLLRSRMSSGYKVYRANGGKVGRKEGYRKSEEAMRAQYNKEMSLLRKGISLRNVQSITGTSVNTLRKLREMM